MLQILATAGEKTMAQRKYMVMDVEDYLALCKSSTNARYEYLDGEEITVCEASIP